MTPRIRAFAALAASCSQILWAQQAEIAPVRPVRNILERPYSPVFVPPVRLANSGRLAGLIRAGKLYLSPQDAVALALENNIDIEVARYTPLMLTWRLERSEAGGALPGVPSGASQANSVTSGQGVLGSQSAAGVSGGGSAGNGGSNAGNASISQIGPVTQTLDPSVQETSTFAHRTALQANSTQSRTLALAQDSRNHSVAVQQGFLTGGNMTATFRDSYLRENAVTDLLNPSVAQSFTIQVQHNLLQGFGIAVNARNITVAKNNLAMTDLDFRTTVSRTVASVINSYWALAGDYEDLKAKQEAFDIANRFLEENRKRVDLGALAPIDVVTSRNQVASSQLDLVNSRTALAQAELQLKNLISRTGDADPLLAGVSIVPTGSITIPAADNLAVPELIAKALVGRTDLQSAQASLKNSEISNLGTRNGLLPQVQAFATVSSAGLAGEPHTVRGEVPDPYFVGGVGTALGQVLRHNFPSESVGVFARVPLNNRQAQADFGIDQLQYRQSQLTSGRDRNQAAVDVTNSVVAIRQARARYEAAHANVALSQELLDGEQQKFSLGESTAFNVVQQQRDLATAKSSELAALVGYQRARINLDAMTGEVIEANGVNLK